MRGFGRIALCVLLLQVLGTIAVKVRVVMHSDQEDSKIDEEEPPHTDSWPEQKKEVSLMPYLKHARKTTQAEEFEREEREEKTTTEKALVHPNELIFPLIYKQSHINSMFKFGENWYTWSTEKRTDGSKGINYYVCYEEPKHCDDVGWERTDALPKCAFQIDSLLPDDRACINNFGVEPHHSHSFCDGGEQMKVSEMVKQCGPRIRSLWRFFRVGRRPVNAQKPADVNSLVCEDEEECFITIEYRIHHDRITFSLHEPNRGQTFKSALKRDFPPQEEQKTTTEALRVHKKKRIIEKETKMEAEEPPKTKKVRLRSRSKVVEGKGIAKESNSGYRRTKNKIKVREDVSEDISL